MYLKELSSAKPSPGGGSAGALALSLGAGLAEMALKVSRRKFSGSVLNKIDFNLKELKNVRQKALKLSGKDARVFQRFSLEKDPAKKQKLLKQALDVSLEIGRLAVLSAGIIDKTSGWIKKNIASDRDIGAMLTASALKAAVLNAEINLKYLALEDKKNQGRLREIKQALAGVKKYFL